MSHWLSFQTVYPKEGGGVEHGDMTIIYMQDNFIDCGICSKKAPHKWAVAINDRGEIVSDDDKTSEWYGLQVCESCFKKASERKIRSVW